MHQIPTGCIRLRPTRFHLTRDVQWQKKMFYAPDKAESIHAVDSVELITKHGKVPIRTIPPSPEPDQNAEDDAEWNPDVESPKAVKWQLKPNDPAT